MQIVDLNHLSPVKQNTLVVGGDGLIVLTALEDAVVLVSPDGSSIASSESYAVVLLDAPLLTSFSSSSSTSSS